MPRSESASSYFSLDELRLLFDITGTDPRRSARQTHESGSFESSILGLEWNLWAQGTAKAFDLVEENTRETGTANQRAGEKSCRNTGRQVRQSEGSANENSGCGLQFDCGGSAITPDRENIIVGVDYKNVSRREALRN